MGTFRLWLGALTSVGLSLRLSEQTVLVRVLFETEVFQQTAHARLDRFSSLSTDWTRAPGAVRCERRK